MENPQSWWYLPGKIGIFMGYVSFREGKLSKVVRLIHAEGFEMRNPWRSHSAFKKEFLDSAGKYTN